MDRLPALLADLFDTGEMQVLSRGPDTGVDAVARDLRGHDWLFQVKASGGALQVKRAAHDLDRVARDDAIKVLVVPFMTKAGADAAEELDVNWMDLSGNARLQAEGLHVWVSGRPNTFKTRGRPSSPFAPRSARISRQMLLAPAHWWRQADLANVTGLDAATVSRTVRRLDDLQLLERQGHELRPADAGDLLDAWSGDYRFDRHDIVAAQLSGDGVKVAQDLGARLRDVEIHHAFTGLPAAWMFDQFARFRMVSVFVDEDPRAVIRRLKLRRIESGGNLQLIGPRDSGVFQGESVHEGLCCVSPAQIYLDLQHLPERSKEAAEYLRRRVLERND